MKSVTSCASYVLTACLVLFFSSQLEGSKEGGNPPGLGQVVYQPLPLGSIRPAGWLERQLRIQANGLTGHLDEFWPDVRESGWIGGQAEGWERAPYWLDGLVPLAYLLDDPGLQRKASRYIEYTILHQQADGWLGPEQSSTGNYKARDPWPVFVMMKVLTQYQEATGDDRVVPVITRFFRQLERELDQRALFDWNRMRWQDGVLSLFWLFDRHPEPWLLDLADKMHRQGYDWATHFADLPHRSKVDKWDHISHVVNNAMGLKAPGLWHRRSQQDIDRNGSIQALHTLDRYHGQVNGVFSGDECFAGRMPSQGTETCAVVEYMYSLEWLLSLTGDPLFGDRLEKVAFNALPAAFGADMWSRQYVQQANQPIVKVSENRIYTTNGPKANIFGLETNYGCCTANMHQGWPKFVAHLWMRSTREEEGLAAFAYGPSRLTTSINGAKVQIELSTDYPFSEELRFRIATDRPVTFPLELRIPAWTVQPTLKVEGESVMRLRPGQVESVRRQWSGSVVLTLNLPMPVQIERRFNNAVAIKRGPLLFSLKIDEDWKRLEGTEPQADWEVFPITPWNYALEIDEDSPKDSISFERRGAGEVPFGPLDIPVRAFVKGRLLPEWTLEQNAAAPPPPSPVTSQQPLETLVLIPYGTAKLRITEFPTLSPVVE